jgi:formate hydrogenlyase transcriptional activator
MAAESFNLDENFQNPARLLGALTDPEQLIAAYLHSSTIGLCVLDSNLRYVSINDTLAQINGFAPAAHLGRTLRDMVGGIADQIELLLQEVFRHGKPILNFEVDGVMPAKQERGQWIDHFFPIRDALGEVTKVGIVVVEISEQRHLHRTFLDLNLKLRKEVSRLQMQVDVVHLISSNWDIPAVFPHISARIRRVLCHEYASLALHDGRGSLVRQAIDFPLGKGFTTALEIAAGDNPSNHVLQTGAPKTFTKDELGRYEGDVARSFVAEGLQSLCCIPLLRPKGPLGVVVLGSTRRDAFQQDDVKLLEEVAEQLAIAIENQRAVSEIEGLKDRLSQERKYLEGEMRAEGHFAEIVGESQSLKQVLDQAATVASSDATVLILGETGTGKELIARAIHRMSRRKVAPFVKLNCAAIPTGLLESELFGHEKGAFTGAITQKVGRLELADGGTLFLDEVGEIPLELQPKLLRVLQDQEFERLGSNRTIQVNLRLVAATNRDLVKSIANQQFRSDLFYRLSVFPIRLPPLRERREDIPILIRHFVRKFSLRMNRSVESIPKETMETLSSWSWPGNVRELENLMERAVILSDRRVLQVPLDDLRIPESAGGSESDSTLDSAERQHIVRTLRDTGGVQSGPNGAARRLGLKRTTLQSKMQRLKITRKDYFRPSN